MAPLGLGGIAGAIHGFVENVDEAQRIGMAAVRAQSRVMQRVLGNFVLAWVAVLRLASNALAILVAAGAITYLNAGAATMVGSLRLSGAVSAWRGLPPAVVSLVLIVLVSLLWETLRLKAKLAEPSAR
jgi:hypothetical protein